MNFLPDVRHDSARTSAGEVASNARDGAYLLDPPYQRGSVWTPEQRRRLIRSLQMGLPVGAVWVHVNDYAPDVPHFTVVDGRQRIETIAAWFNDEFSVPTWWFNPRPYEAERNFPLHVPATHTADEVRYSDLARPGQMRCKTGWAIAVLSVKNLTLAEQADLFVLVNEGGTFQTDEDMDRARSIAAGETA